MHGRNGFGRGWLGVCSLSRLIDNVFHGPPRSLSGVVLEIKNTETTFDSNNSNVLGPATDDFASADTDKAVVQDGGCK